MERRRLLMWLAMLAFVVAGVVIALQEARETLLPAEGLILLGPQDGVDLEEPWWLDVAVVEGMERTPVVDTTLTFLLWLDEDPKGVVPVERTTDAEGHVDIGPLHASLEKQTLRLHARSAHYAIWRAPAVAEVASEGERELRATYRVSWISNVAGRVALPAGVPGRAAVLWRKTGRWLRSWSAVRLDQEGRFHDEGFGKGPVTLEAAVAWEGRRWYGRATVAGGTNDVQIDLVDARPGDPALLHLHLIGPEGAPAAGEVNVTLVDTEFRERYRSVSLRGTGALAFLYEPFSIKLEAEGSRRSGLGRRTVEGLSVEQTEVTVELPKVGEQAAGYIHPVEKGHVFLRLLRPTPFGGAERGLVVRVRNVGFEDRGTRAYLVRGTRIVDRVRLDPNGIAPFFQVQDLEGFQVWIPRLPGGRYVWAKELDAVPSALDRDAKEVTLTPHVGGTVRGTLRCAGGTLPKTWSVLASGPAHDGWSIEVGTFEVRYDGATFEVLGVPPGAWPFSLWHKDDGEYEIIDFEGRAGEHVVIEVPAR